MKVTFLLADAAQAVNGKLYILGGGWSQIGPEAIAYAIAMKIEIPWDQANVRHQLRLGLIDQDGRGVRVQGPAGEQELTIDATFESGRPAGLQPGTPLDVVLAINIAGVALRPSSRYEWRWSINGEQREEWRVGFSTKAAR